MDSVKEIAKAVIQTIKKSNAEMASDRLGVCVKCPHFSKFFGMCGICHCFLSIKIHNEGLHCPINKW